jgi:hypothetical protein
MFAFETANKIAEIIEAGKCSEVVTAVKIEQRLRMHTEPSVLRPENNPAFNDFIIKYASMLPSDKADTFEKLLTFPLVSNELTERAYDRLSTIFNGQNKVRQYNFNNKEDLSIDFATYLNNIKEREFWPTMGWTIYKNFPNGYIVCDLPVTQGRDKYPSPYFYFVPVDAIIKAENTQEGQCQYIIYQAQPTKQEIVSGYDKKYIAIDSAAYRVFYGKKDQITLAYESTHDLGYTPAQQFADKKLADNKSDISTFLKQNQITPSLGLLDRYVFKYTSGEHLELYAGFPIYTILEQQCNYRTSDGFECVDGYIEYEDPNGRKRTDPCPQCNGKKLVGPGTVFEIPFMPDQNAQFPAAHVLNGDTDGIRAFAERLESIENRFMINTTGSIDLKDNSQAKNETQILGSLEDRKKIIMQVKSTFEKINKFTVETLGRLRYGEKFSGCVLSYGDKFTLLSQEEAQKVYNLAQTIGAPSYYLSDLRAQIYGGQYKNDPRAEQRAKILSDLEPYKDLSIDQVFKNYDKLDPVKAQIKINFDDLINKFEIENGNILEYMSQVKDYSIKIATINNYFMNQIQPQTAEGLN